MDPRQGQWPLEPFILVGEWERADRDLETSWLALSHSPTNGQIAKGLALCQGSRGQRPLAGSRAEPSRFLGSWPCRPCLVLLWRRFCR